MHKKINSARTVAAKVYVSDEMVINPGANLEISKGFRLATLEEAISRFIYDSNFRRDLDGSRDWALVDGNRLDGHGYHELFEDGSYNKVTPKIFDNLDKKKRSMIYNNGPGQIIICCNDYSGADMRMEISTYPMSSSPMPMKVAYVRDDGEASATAKNGKPVISIIDDTVTLKRVARGR